MAITTLDGLIAGMYHPEIGYKTNYTAEAAGLWHSTFYLAGSPGAAAAPTPGMGGAALTTYAGQISFPAAVGGENVYLARFGASHAAGVGSVMLCDRLWHNSGIVVTTTTAQTITSAAWPARDALGATNGDDVLIGLEVRTATTNASAITSDGSTTGIRISYTNSAGTAGKTGYIPSFPATAVAGTFMPFYLAAGDDGVRSIETITLTTSLGGGAVHLVAYRPLAVVGTPTANIQFAQDGVQLGLPRCYDNTVPFVLHQVTATTVGVTTTEVVWAQG
jgi:hypothetical protein